MRHGQQAVGCFLEQADNQSIFELDALSGWHLGQTWHGHDVASYNHDEFSTGRQTHFANGHGVTARRALQRRVSRERVQIGRVHV